MAIDNRTTRLGMLAVVAMLLMGLLGTRLWFLQGVEAASFQAKVSAAKLREVLIPPERGRIFDSKMRIMADNQRILTVAIDWSIIKKPKIRNALFDRLSGPLKVPVIDLQRRYDPCFDEPTIPKCTKGQRYSTLLPLPLKEGVDEDTVTYIKERSEDFPGIQIVEQWKRVYPYSPLASHVVGYLGPITKETKKQYEDAGYNTNELVGAFGVELSMESALHGSWGRQVFEVDAAGGIVHELLDEHVDPVAGKDIQLTIDLDMQQYAEQALETKLFQRRHLPTDILGQDVAAHNPIDPKKPEGIERVYSSSKEFGTQEWIQYKAPAGSVVIENNSNGQIIAMASYPRFDNRWMGNISGDKFDQLFGEKVDPATGKADPDKSVLVNRAVQGRYNLGSSFKPFVAWSAMHSGIIGPHEPYLDQGIYKLESIPDDVCASGVRCEFKNASNIRTNKPSSYGPVAVADALAVSSDAFFYRLGEKFWEMDEHNASIDPTLKGKSTLKDDLERFGFGNETGVQLPFEWAGRIPDDAIKAQLVKDDVLGANEAPRLLVGDNVQVAIGQGLMAATPLQLANAYSTIANGGFQYVPTVVKTIFDPLVPDLSPGVADISQAVVYKSFETPKYKDQLEMPPEIIEPIIDGLTRVTNAHRVSEPGVRYPQSFYHTTTGEKLFESYPMDVLPIAGKTGTAQGFKSYPWNDSSAFGAFSLDKAQPFTVVAYLEKAGFGSKAAAPVVKCIFTALAGRTVMDPVQPSDPLDLNSLQPAPPTQLADSSCMPAAVEARD
ncbi:MAG: penicillin-binding transpeptidase domain-containing protein [Ilumatobacteraceae bacterium]